METWSYDLQSHGKCKERKKGSLFIWLYLFGFKRLKSSCTFIEITRLLTPTLIKEFSVYSHKNTGNLQVLISKLLTKVLLLITISILTSLGVFIQDEICWSMWEDITGLIQDNRMNFQCNNILLKWRKILQFIISILPHVTQYPDLKIPQAQKNKRINRYGNSALKYLLVIYNGKVMLGRGISLA